MAPQCSPRGRLLAGFCLLVSFTLTGCVQEPVTPSILPTCISSVYEANPYMSHVRSGAVEIHDNYMNNRIDWYGARQVAFSRLKENTEHWSDAVDVALSDSQMVRITITYVDPVLVHYIVLNQELSNNIPALNNFDAELQFVMNKLAERHELIFVVTISAPLYQPQVYTNVARVDLPIDQLALITASDLKIYPTHEDHILDENLEIAHGPVSGIVGYPISVLTQDNCTWLMDPWNTTLTLDIPWVTLDGTSVGSQFWSIPFRPLVAQDDGLVNLELMEPTPTYDLNFDWNRASRASEPPTPNWHPNAVSDTTDWKMYWEDMGRHMWYLFITETHH